MQARAADGAPCALRGLLAFEFPFAEAFVDLEASFLGIRDGEGFEFVRSAEAGNDLADRLFAGRAMGERLGGERSVQGEPATASGAVAFA